MLITEFNDASTIPAIATRDGDEWRVEVTVSDGDDTVSRSSQIITVGGITQVNNPPEISTISISPSQPVTAEDLQLIYSAQDQENDAILDTEIEWRVDGLLTGFVTSTIDAVETAKGQVWEVSIRISDGKDWSSWYQQSVIIGNTPPVVESLTVSPIDIFTNDDILAEYSISDIDGDTTITPLITWSKNGMVLTEFDGVNPLPAAVTTKGDIWSVSVIADDGDSVSQDDLEATVVVQNSLPCLLYTSDAADD